MPRLKLPIYMDYHSTTPVDRRVLESMLPTWERVFGNAASVNHAFGDEAFKLVEDSRQAVARLINARSEEIIFTSGATESNNLAVKGVAAQYGEKQNHMISCVAEHRSLLGPLRSLEGTGFQVTYLTVSREGRLNLEDLDKALRSNTVLISVMAANNEVGTLYPIREIGKWAKKNKILFHTDATQALGLIPVDVEDMGIDLLSLSAHKMYGPKGIGALYVRSKNPYVRLKPQIDGGGHEKGLRSGTLNVPGIVGLGKACEIIEVEREKEAKRLKELRNRLWKGLQAPGDVSLNGSLENRLPNNLNVSFAFVEAESLLKKIRDIAVSSGSACASAKPQVSHVLKAMGVPEELVHTSIRFSLGRFTTAAEVDYTIKKVVKEVQALRKASELYRMAKHDGPGPEGCEGGQVRK